MFNVYILKSLSNENKYYTGYTSDLKKRIQKHNNGEVQSTSKFKPWEINCYFAFNTRRKPCLLNHILKHILAEHSPVSTFDNYNYFFINLTISSSILFGLVEEAYLSITLPSLSMRNLVKFHLIASPGKPDCCALEIHREDEHHYHLHLFY